MLGGLFTPASRFRKTALILAIVWTIGIFIACLWPGKELPHSDIPFVDKWTHFILFGAFAFLWLCAFPSGTIRTLFLIILVSAALGWLVECLQGWLPQLGRSKDNMDAVADGVGGILGTLVFRMGIAISQHNKGKISVP
jgi:VanZ family protein